MVSAWTVIIPQILLERIAPIIVLGITAPTAPTTTARGKMITKPKRSGIWVASNLDENFLKTSWKASPIT